MRFRNKNTEAYQQTRRISLVSSFLVSLFLDQIAPLDVSDVCGMNLWDIKRGRWNETLLKLAGGDSRDCQITPFTGDNPATILSLPLRPLDAIVSLGTSTTFLMSTTAWVPNPQYHFFSHPTTSGLYMFMLCYKNGGLAREKVRDAINAKTSSVKDQTSWAAFDELLQNTPPLAQRDDSKHMKMGLYFPRPEIIPNLPIGEWHFNYYPETKKLEESDADVWKLEDDARIIVESQ